MKPGVYFHYKGKYYLVLFTAVHSETREEYVVYKPLYENSEEYVIRPRAMFEERVLLKNGLTTKRFELV